VAPAEELFAYPLHPYTRSLISAIPIPDPRLEKSKVTLTYDPSVHDYSKETPRLEHIGHDHYVFGSSEELAAYRAIREKGEPLTTAVFQADHAPAASDTAVLEEDRILERPVHDTGSRWYTAASFLLPPIGLAAGAVFKRFRYIRCYRACKTGALAGLGTLGAIVGLFGLALLLAVI